MEDWVKDFLEWSPGSPVSSRRSVRRESRRRSLRLLKRQSIDTLPDPIQQTDTDSESVSVQEKLNVLNSVENFPEKQNNKSSSSLDSSYGTVWLAFDSCNTPVVTSSRKRRQSVTECKQKRSISQENFCGAAPCSNEQDLNTQEEVPSQSGGKRKPCRRKSLHKKRQSFALSVPPIEELEAEFASTHQANCDPPKEELDQVPRDSCSGQPTQKQKELLSKSLEKRETKIASYTVDVCDQDKACEVITSVKQPCFSTEDEDSLDSRLPFSSHSEKPKHSRRKESCKKRRSGVFSVPPIQELEAEFDLALENYESLDKNSELVSLSSYSETTDKPSRNENELFAKSSEECKTKTTSCREDSCDQENSEEVNPSVDQPFCSYQEEDVLDLLAPLPSFSAKVKALRRKSSYKKRQSFVLSVPPILELESESDASQGKYDKENVPEIIPSLNKPYLNVQQEDVLDSVTPLSAFLHSSLKSRTLRRKSSYKQSRGFTPSVPAIEELESELNSSEENCDSGEEDSEPCISPVHCDFVAKGKFSTDISKSLPSCGKSSEALDLSGFEVAPEVKKIVPVGSSLSAYSHGTQCDADLRDLPPGGFSTRALTENESDSPPEICRSSTPESQLRHMHRFLSPDKPLDCKNEVLSGGLLFNVRSPPDMEQTWVSAADLEELLNNRSLDRKMTIQSPDRVNTAAFPSEQMEVSSPCSPQLNSNLCLDCVEMSVISALDPVITDIGPDETREKKGCEGSNTSRDIVMDTGADPGGCVDLSNSPSTCSKPVNMDVHVEDPPDTELSPPAIILLMGSGGGSTGHSIPGCSCDPPQLWAPTFSEPTGYISPLSNPSLDQSSTGIQMADEPVLKEIKSKSQQLKEPRKRKRLLEQISQEGLILDDPQEPGQSRRSTRVRRKSVEFFSNPQKQPNTADSSSSFEIFEGAKSPEHTEPKKKKRKTKKTESLEDIYLNKNFKKVVEKMYETIYEDPERGIGQRRQRRSITFDTFVVHPAKVKRRAQKAAKFNGGAAVRKKRAVPQTYFDKKMAALEEELRDLDST